MPQNHIRLSLRFVLGIDADSKIYIGQLKWRGFETTGLFVKLLLYSPCYCPLYNSKKNRNNKKSILLPSSSSLLLI